MFIRKSRPIHATLRSTYQHQFFDPPPWFQPRLHHWLRDWERGRSAEYERVTAEVQERRIDFFLALEKVLTPAQRERALKRLEGFGNDFKTLSDRAAATALTATIAAL